MRPLGRSTRRAAASWAVAWTLLCTFLVLAPIVQAVDAEVNFRPPATSRLSQAEQDQPVTLQSAPSGNLAAPGLRLSPGTVSLVEGGDPVSYEVVLRKAPSALVVVSMYLDEQTAVSTSVLIFQPGDWDKPQLVSIWAEDDDLMEGPHTGSVSHYTASTDPAYNNLDPVVLEANIEDNDGARILVTPKALTVAEPDGTASLTLQLSGPPGEAVTIPLKTSNKECSVSPTSLSLDAENWLNGVEAVVAANDDTVEDGEQTCLIKGGPSSSNDPAYDGLNFEDVVVTVLDDDEGWQILMPVVIQLWPPLPAAPALQAINNADGNGTYTVHWEAAALAAMYILEEARDPAFVTAQEIYSGPATNLEVTGQGAARLYYRVKGQNAWGDSSWSAVQKVDVLWEAEPNDDALTQANGPLAPGLIYNGTFPTPSDEKDYYYFDLLVAGTVRLWLQDMPGGRNYDLVLRDSNLETKPGWWSLLTGNQDEFVEATIPKGHYYIQVYNAGGLGSSQPYHLRVQY